MSPFDAEGPDVPSTRPYLIRALHEWCTDHGFTPYLAVHVDSTVRVPLEYVKNQQIVLNASFDATSGLHLGNDHIEFRARFGGVARDIFVPVERVLAIYARENGQGMAFPMSEAGSADDASNGTGASASVAPAPVGARLSAVPSAAPARSAPPTLDAGEGGPPPRDDDPPPSGRPALKRVK